MCPGRLQWQHVRSLFLEVFVSPLFVSFSVRFLLPHVSVVWLSMLQFLHLCFWRLFPRPPPNPLPCPPWPQPRFLPREYRATPVNASPISLVMVVLSAYSLIASIHCWAMAAGICCSMIWMVVSYELDRVVTRCSFMASLAIFSVVPIRFLQKAMDLVKYWVTILSGDGQEAVNFRRTWVRPSFVEALSSGSLSGSHISTGSSILSVSGRSSLQHPRCICASALLARSCQLSGRGRSAKPLLTGRSSTTVTIL